MTPALPPALGRLERVLALATGFSLHFVAGPRDHRDSVFVRLARALGGRFEFVRHRVDAEGVMLLEKLAEGAGERPRVVFVSGLERMGEAERQDATRRLNMNRDTWAGYPAQVIVWLPAWGLREFRDLAPDLWHWSRSLTTLHDAVLPVVDELEYLVWVCERYGGERVRHEDVWWFFEPFLQGMSGLVHGLDSAERSRLAVHATGTLAGARLERRLAAEGQALDLDTRGVWGANAKLPIDVTPVLVRASEAAGHLDPAGWTSLVQAAGVPGGEQAAGLLAELAGRGELLVVLDGFDLLDPDSEGGAARWLRWLREENPKITVIEVPGAGAATERAAVAEDSSSGRIAIFLSFAFRPEELLRLAVFMFGEEFARVLPAMDERSPEDWIFEFVTACERRGLLDAWFFAELIRVRPKFAEQIGAIARAYLQGG